MSAYDDLRKKIEDKSVLGGIIGLGYVGLPLVQHLCNVGYRVLGFDVDPVKTEKIARGESYIKHIESAWIAERVEAGAFSATTNFARFARGGLHQHLRAHAVEQPQ